MEIRVKCPMCGTEFGSGIVIEGGSACLKGNTTKCPNPKCGATVPIPDGTYPGAGTPPKGKKGCCRKPK